MKTLFTLLFGLFIITSAPGQDNDQTQIKKKPGKNQYELNNDVVIGYGYGSLYMANQYVDHDFNKYPLVIKPTENAETIGTFSIGYNRKVTKVIMLGFLASYMECYYTGEWLISGYCLPISAKIRDHILSGIAMVTFNYINKPVVRLYSAVGLGATVVFSTFETTYSDAFKDSDRQILPAGQFTFIGIRVGHSLGGFAEFGVGTNALFSGGISYQFND